MCACVLSDDLSVCLSVCPRVGLPIGLRADRENLRGSADDVLARWDAENVPIARWRRNKRGPGERDNNEEEVKRQYMYIAQVLEH